MRVAPGHSSTTLLLLGICCFFLGRFLDTVPGLPSPGHGPTVHDGRSKMLLETARPDDLALGAGLPGEPSSDKATADKAVAAAAAKALSVQAGKYPAVSMEELVELSGLLHDKPPQAHGSSGHDFYTVAPFQLLSWEPRAYLFPNFVDPARCDHIKELAIKQMYPSGLAFKAGDTVENTKDVRTSSGTFLTRNSDPDGVLAWVEDKIAAVTGVPAGHGEPFNVLRYEFGQHYDSHFDSFSESEYGRQSSQRIATVLTYLTDVEEGGETVFLLEGKDGLERLKTIDYKACDTGIKVKPRKGDALLFWSVYPDGSEDKHALHGGCPVIKGEKWAMTKWIRNKCHGQTAC